MRDPGRTSIRTRRSRRSKPFSMPIRRRRTSIKNRSVWRPNIPRWTISSVQRAFPLLRYGSASAVVTDPAKRALIAKKDDIENKIDALKYQKVVDGSGRLQETAHGPAARTGAHPGGDRQMMTPRAQVRRQLRFVRGRHRGSAGLFPRRRIERAEALWRRRISKAPTTSSKRWSPRIPKTPITVSAGVSFSGTL